RDTNGKVIASVATPATAHTPFVSLADGRYTWSVTARTNDGTAMALPTADVFTVDTSLEARTKPVIDHDTEQPQVGSTLSVTPLRWSREGVTETYQWLREGVAIKGATKDTYVATVTDHQKAVSVRVTG